MDDPALPVGEHRRALAGLARINAMSFASATLWRAVRSLGVGRGEPVRILDVATGSGDVLLGLYRRAARAGVRLDLTACDISPVALEAAAGRFARASVPLRTLAVDAHEPLPLADRAVDVGVCSLFFHHLVAPDAVRVLAEMARVSARGVVVLDLCRSFAGVVAARVVPRLVTCSRVVHVDAVRSAKGALDVRELLYIASDSGVHGATVRRVFPWRMTLVWRREA